MKNINIISGIKSCFYSTANLANKAEKPATSNIFAKLSTVMEQWCDPSDKNDAELRLQTLTSQGIDNTKTVYAKMSAFIRLVTLAGEMHRDDFKINVTSCLNLSNAHAQNGFCQITFFVENILNKTSIWFGDPMHELYCALKVPLTNSSEYFATKSSLSAEKINLFMQNNLALVIDDNDQ
ncbi:MAG TPA: hypothetical protein ACHBX0_10890 [Arsenophonus sp.]